LKNFYFGTNLIKFSIIPFRSQLKGKIGTTTPKIFIERCRVFVIDLRFALVLDIADKLYVIGASPVGPSYHSVIISDPIYSDITSGNIPPEWTILNPVNL